MTTTDRKEMFQQETSRKQHILSLLREAAAKACAEGDPWAKYHLEDCIAERIERHLYDPVTEQWHTDETIVKMEPEPFTNGAMRFCYRLKKRAQPPLSATNHRFHRTGWKNASNYVAKAYHKNDVIDCSEEAKDAVRKDIILQYEANRWADVYNDADPPSKIHFIRAYAISFPDRPGEPWFALERFISGHDRYGATFVKHNTNAGFVDKGLRRLTPQVFSAFSFYASRGTRLVADIQGVGDLYTDPQVLSSDYRFGDGDLGPRGMALFFKNFRHCSMSDGLRLPIFPLSRHELQVQVKYEEDEETVSDTDITEGSEPPLNMFQRLDMNRLNRVDPLKSPMDLMQLDQRPTERRSNLHHHRDVVSQSVRKSLQQQEIHLHQPPSPTIKSLHRTKSDVCEVQQCLDRARRDKEYTHRDFHRKSSGQLRQRHYKRLDSSQFRKGAALVRKLSDPMLPDNQTRENLGKVHYQLAVLHGMGRFPDVEAAAHVGHEGEDEVSHDAFSVLFHLSYGASQRNAPSCLALARVQAGLDTTVSNLLQTIVPVDFDSAKELLERAMYSNYGSVGPKASAACLLYQILQDESHVADYDEQKSEKDSDMDLPELPSHQFDKIDVLQQAIRLLNEMESESAEAQAHRERREMADGGSSATIKTNDRVEANYCLEGSFYSSTVTEISSDGELITVCYDDDGSSEQLPKVEVRLIIPPTVTQTNLGGPLSDDEAFGENNRVGDDAFLLSMYQLQAELAECYVTSKDYPKASSLLQEASEGAMNDGKMKLATQWSLRAAEFENP